MSKNNKFDDHGFDEIDIDIYNTNDNIDDSSMKKYPDGQTYNNAAVIIQKHNDGISLFEKICFAVAGMSFQIQFCALGVFSSVFLLNVAKIPPEKNIYILFVSRAVDALKDPIYGYFIDRSRITRWGKMKPWIFIHTPLTAITYSLLWYIPDGFSENQLFAWFLIWNSFYFIISTGARIPHTAMTMYLCSSLHDREIATVLRMGFEMLGLLLALGIQGPLVSADSYCVNSTTVDPFGTTAIDFELTSLTPPIEQTVWERHKYLFISLILNVFYLLGYYMLIIFVKEDIDLVRASEAKKAQETQNISTLREIKRMFTFKPFVLLCISTICSISLIQMIQNTLQLYFEYGYYKVKYLFNYAIIGLLILSICFVPLWQYLMRRFEKKYLVIIGNLSMVPLSIGTIFFSEDSALEITLFFLLLVLGANCFTSIFLLPWAMLPNVLDEYLLTYGNKLDALFYTFYSLGIKILISLFAGLTQLVLSLVDFKTNECYQNDSVTIAVKLLISIGPLICAIVGSVVIFFYPIDNATARENSERVKHITKSQANGEMEMKPDNLHYEENLGYVSENNLRL